MDKVLIYICYDSFEYTNYYSMAINNQKVCDLVSEEQKKDLFSKCEELNISKSESRWCIVQDEDATNWDYVDEITALGYKLNPLMISYEELLAEMNELFEIDLEPSVDKKVVEIIYPETFNESTIASHQQEVINDVTQKLESEGMTELAKIIKEKYERMSRHE